MFAGFTIVSLFTSILSPAPPLKNERFEILVRQDHSFVIKEITTSRQWQFKPDFVILTSSEDPEMEMRPAGIENVMYNVVTWKAYSSEENNLLRSERVGKDVAGDGFDDRILKGNNDLRTSNVFASGEISRQSANDHIQQNNRIIFRFPENNYYNLSAELFFTGSTSFPTLRFTFVALEENYYSVGFTGAPVYDRDVTTEIWQPLVWQEKRFPESSILTLAFQCPIPSALACTGEGCVGVVAGPDEFPFDPLPLLDNSRFGIALRTEDGKVRPMLFAPAPGGAESRLKKDTSFSFQMQLFIGDEDITRAFEQVAREIYQFKDYRSNSTNTLNETLDNMLQYGMSDYSMFIDSLKGCAYSTDVPGAVKNVSSLNPLQMALLTDDETIYWKRAYPIMEFLLSREKFLFTLDSTQKIQNPSRKMNGPVAPVSEMATLFQISGGKSDALLDLAQGEYTKSRTRNLSVEEKGNTWQNALALYQATRQKQFLDKAVEGANAYLSRRVLQPSENFKTVEGGFFFWNGFTPDWINLFQLFEITRDTRYLEAARSGARHYTMFCWYSPLIPDKSILVNKGNKAPHYWYLMRKGHEVMTVPEELVPAWRLSEIGLTPESSGTSSGHRAIFMANYAPWMLRIGYHSGDEFLTQTAKAAVVGRYSNFPGYHINTARTTAYEKSDYPLKPFKQLSVNSFHFNHIWPHMSILVDYLFSDTYVRSKGAIDIPSAYIEGYAYLQSKFYGHAPGEFYGEKNIYPWMPSALVSTQSEQLNYVAFRGNNAVYIAFLNQSPKKVVSKVTLNPALLPGLSKRGHNVNVWVDNAKLPGIQKFINGDFEVTVNAGGITAIKIHGLKPSVDFQNQVYTDKSIPSPGLVALENVNGKAMVLDFGPKLKTLYVYLHDDDQKVSETRLIYRIGGQERVITDRRYPYEFTVSLPDNLRDPEFLLQAVDHTGAIREDRITLGKD